VKFCHRQKQTQKKFCLFDLSKTKKRQRGKKPSAIWSRSYHKKERSERYRCNPEPTMVVFILTPDEILQKGLHLVGFDDRRQQNVSRKTNLSRFKVHFGSLPVVYAQIWEDLQTTDVPEARIDTKKDLNVDNFLAAVNFLKSYRTEVERSGTFGVCDTTARKWAWFYATKIQALKKQKVNEQKLNSFATM
jgi:hypothetical protein